MLTTGQWYLTLVLGQSTTEFFEDQQQVSEASFKQLPWRENLFLVFGTFSLLEALMPINKDCQLPLTGLEWTFLKDEGQEEDKDTSSLLKSKASTSTKLNYDESEVDERINNDLD
jgi:hypothetical protein